jgi:hypothetical protein
MTPAPTPPHLETAVTQLRAALFDLEDAARQALPLDRTEVHVALQAAGYELGRAEHHLARLP